MRKLSLWARHHPVYARIIIVISHCILSCLAYFLATQLLKKNIILSPALLYILTVVFLVVSATYPRKKRENYKTRKFYDLIVTCCSFFMVLCGSYQLNAPISFYQTAQATIVEKPYKYDEARKLLEQFKAGQKTRFTGREKRVIRKEFNYQLLRYAKAKVAGDKESGGQAVLIIVTCITAVGLFFLLMSLACALACNGSEAFALIVMLLGTAAIVWGMVAIIRSIERKRVKPKSL